MNLHVEKTTLAVAFLEFSLRNVPPFRRKNCFGSIEITRSLIVILSAIGCGIYSRILEIFLRRIDSFESEKKWNGS
jgi:hypothetical protein